MWQVDADRSIDRPRILQLSQLSGISFEDLESTFLYPTCDAISGLPLDEQNKWRWLRTVGRRNNTRKGGIQYCGQCLAQGKEPYYRLAWRLVYHTHCMTHSVRLRESCWNCRRPIDLHRSKAFGDGIRNCMRCGADLCTGNYGLPDEFSIQFQKDADNTLNQGEAIVFDNRRVSAAEWFELSYFLYSLVRRTFVGRSNALNVFFETVGIQLGSERAIIPKYELGKLDVSSRIRIFNVIAKMQKKSISDIFKALILSEVSLEAFMGDNAKIPRPLEVDSLRLLRRLRLKRKKSKLVERRRSKREVVRMMQSIHRLSSMT